MKTDNIYIATLSMLVSNDYKLSKSCSKKILVERQGKYPMDHYSDISTEVLSRPSSIGLNPGDIFIDTLMPFNYVTHNKRKNLSKKKILKIYGEWRCKNEKSI